MKLYDTYRRTLSETQEPWPNGFRSPAREFDSIETVAEWLGCHVGKLQFDPHKGEWSVKK